MIDDNWICIGYLQSTFGLEGAVKIATKLKNPQDLFSIDTIYDEYNQGPYKLSQIGNISGTIVKAKIKAVRDRSHAEQLIGAKLFTNQLDFELEDSAEEFLHEVGIMGYQVFNDENQHIGEVIDVIDTGKQVSLVIQKADETVSYLPWVDDFIKEQNPDEQKIIIDPPIGWEEL